ncbi:MAG TPA: class I SAM-dependent methyltransferase [Acidimicrobiales bacterium]
MIRRAYVRGVRGVAAVLDAIGVGRWLSRRTGPVGRHLYSLLAIYDLERMVALGLPWWTYGAIDEVDRFLAERKGKARVFEFGAGASTLWLAERAGEVHSVEHDLSFVELLEPKVKPLDNVHLRPVAAVAVEDDGAGAITSGRKGYEGLDFTDYVAAIDAVGGPFDLVIVDGRARDACLRAAVRHLADDGVILFDNAGRDRYQAAIRECGLDVEVKAGWAPSLPYREATALLRKPR